MKRRIAAFLFGLGVGILVTASVSVGASNLVKATLTPNTKVIVNGEQAKLSDSPINVNGKAYLPLRDTASAMGYSVASASGGKIELVEGATSQSSKSTATTSTTAQPTKTDTTKVTETSKGGKTFNVEQYTKGDKLDSEKIAAAIASGELTINSQDANGDSILHWVIRKNDYATYLVIKKNALNVNIQNNKLQTPLHEAVLDENGFYLGELTNTFNANANLKDDQGKKPIDYTTKNSTGYSTLKGYMM